MSLHFLDPRRAGEPTYSPDVDLIETQWGWRAVYLHDKDRSTASRLIPGTLLTESAALAAARVAAGFGHVAERACDTYHGPFVTREWNSLSECKNCGWLGDAHKEGSK